MEVVPSGAALPLPLSRAHRVEVSIRSSDPHSVGQNAAWRFGRELGFLL